MLFRESGGRAIGATISRSSHANYTGDIRPLSIFVHRASECLTDYESHGEGLICFSLLNGLAARGHEVFAFADRVAIHAKHERLHVNSGGSRSPFHSLSPWEQSWRARRYYAQVTSRQAIDLVWYMNPCHALPSVPITGGKPLIIGPLYYQWPTDGASPESGKPRFGIGLGRFLQPMLRRGWQNALSQAALVICCTEAHASATQQGFKAPRVLDLPIIVERPGQLPSLRAPLDGKRPLRLVFVGHLASRKRPRLFCEIVSRLHTSGLAVEGTVVGEGEEYEGLVQLAREENLPIRFVGKLPNHEVWSEVQSADVFVSTAMGEPYGRAIAEAMAVGTPAICHRSGGPADFISDGVNGMLVDHLDAGTYADRIRSVVVNGTLPRLSEGARSKAQEWTADRILTRLEVALDSVRPTALHS